MSEHTIKKYKKKGMKDKDIIKKGKEIKKAKKDCEDFAKSSKNKKPKNCIVLPLDEISTTKKRLKQAKQDYNFLNERIECLKKEIEDAEHNVIKNANGILGCIPQYKTLTSLIAQRNKLHEIIDDAEKKLRIKNETKRSIFD